VCLGRQLGRICICERSPKPPPIHARPRRVDLREP
jgi:hypothetical protein